MKAGREHRVPLSDRAIKLLKSLPREDGNDHAFIGPRKAGLSNMAFLTLLKRMGHNDITTHGFRSSFRGWCAARTNYPREVAELALAHTNRDRVEAAYQRDDLIDKRRQLMAEWATFCFTPPAKSAKVVSIRAAAQ